MNISMSEFGYHIANVSSILLSYTYLQKKLIHVCFPNVDSNELAEKEREYTT